MSKDPTEKIKKSIENVIGANTTLKRRKKTEDDIQYEKFELIIRTLEEVEIRSAIMEEDFSLNFSDYDEKFFVIIDNLLEMYLGKDAMDVVNFYLYSRINPDGTINEIADEDGNLIPLETVRDLWEVVKFVQNNPKTKKK